MLTTIRPQLKPLPLIAVFCLVSTTGVTLAEEGVLAHGAEVEQLADGRVFTGRQAKSVLLVDEIGDLQDAIKLAGELSGIEGTPRVMETTKPFSFQEFLESNFLGNVRALTPSRFSAPLLYLWVA